MSASIAFAQPPALQPLLKTIASTDATRMAESIQFYKQMHAVLSHPRRVNCHPKDDTANLNRHVHTPSGTREPETAGRQWIDVYSKLRERVPVPKAEFERVVAVWPNSGGACPD